MELLRWLAVAGVWRSGEATADQWCTRQRDAGVWCSGFVWGYVLSQQAQQVKGITVVLT